MGVADPEGPLPFSKHQEKYMQLFDAIFATMTMVNYEMPANWAQPLEGSGSDSANMVEEEDPDAEVIE